MKPIVFQLPWRGREPGHVDRALDEPIAAILVQRGIAKYCDPPAAGDQKPEGEETEATGETEEQTSAQEPPTTKVRRKR